MGLLFGIFQVWNVYGHSGNPKLRDQLFETVLPELLMVWQGRSISGSDENSVHNSVWTMDANGITRKIDDSNFVKSKLSKTLIKTTETFGMRDAYVSVYGERVPVEYTRRRGLQEGSRIDQIYVNGSLRSLGLKQIPNPNGNDHDLLIVPVKI